jgi:hypothetical protein
MSLERFRLHQGMVNGSVRTSVPVTAAKSSQVPGALSWHKPILFLSWRFRTFHLPARCVGVVEQYADELTKRWLCLSATRCPNALAYTETLVLLNRLHGVAVPSARCRIANPPVSRQPKSKRSTPGASSRMTLAVSALVSALEQA